MQGPSPAILGLGPPPLPSVLFFFDGHLQPCLQQSEHRPIGDPSGQALKKWIMGNAIKVAAEVGVDHLGIALP
ncbi:hypothetical protein KZZ20_06660 [Methylacidiphilum fumariolicum]|nr:hypothetical protein [Candidatus Methylacidiphilum fumarolicum]